MGRKISERTGEPLEGSMVKTATIQNGNRLRGT